MRPRSGARAGSLATSYAACIEAVIELKTRTASIHRHDGFKAKVVIPFALLIRVPGFFRTTDQKPHAEEIISGISFEGFRPNVIPPVEFALLREIVRILKALLGIIREFVYSAI